MTPVDTLTLDALPTDPDGPALSAYLLGVVGFEEMLQFQRRLHYDITGQRDQAALILCEHPPLISVGRQGSARHIQIDQEELNWRGWPVRWVQRGGGCWLHLPGQLAIYFLLPLDRCGLYIPDFQARFTEVLCRVLQDFTVRAAPLAGHGGVVVGARLVAALGMAVRDGVTAFGACLNVHPDLDQYRFVRSHPLPEQPMTSLVRERRGPLRPALVRQRLLEHLGSAFPFSRVSFFSDHPALRGAQQRCANLTAPVSS